MVIFANSRVTARSHRFTANICGVSAGKPKAATHGSFWLRDWLIEPALNEVSRGEVSRRIEPKAMDVLVRLASPPLQVVSKDELLATVWAGTSVTEHVLVRVIWQLRQVLGEDSIQTVPKRGYRLTASVRTATEDAKESSGGTASGFAAGTEAKGRRSILLSVLVAILVLVCVIAALTWRYKILTPAVSSLAVLPLANYSADPGQDFLADAITEELTTDLSKIAALRVVSRTSSMQYKRTNKKIPEIAKELGVDAVIEGSIQRAGSQLRVTVQLVHAASERHLWAESYTRDVTDVLALRDELASAIAQAVRIRVSPADRARLQRGRTSVRPAHEDYLRGRHLADSGEWLQSIHYFEKAVERDPQYALAWADLAEAYGMVSFTGAHLDFREKRLAAILRARDLDPDLPEVHDLLGDLKLYRYREWAEGQAEYRRAMESDPGSFDAQLHYALSEWVLGRTDSALHEMRRAKILNPLSPIVSNAIGSLLLQSGRLEEAVAEYRRTREIEPSYAPSYMNLGRAYEKLGNEEQAVSAYLDGLKLRQYTPAELEELNRVFRSSGMASFHRRRLQMQLHRYKQGPEEDASNLEIAAIHAGLGEKDLAFQYLDRAFENHVGGLVWLKVGPEWAPLRSDPRFNELLSRMKFPSS